VCVCVDAHACRTAVQDWGRRRDKGERRDKVCHADYNYFIGNFKNCRNTTTLLSQGSVIAGTRLLISKSNSGNSRANENGGGGHTCISSSWELCSQLSRRVWECVPWGKINV